jgi:HprK-related kinase A
VSTTTLGTLPVEALLPGEGVRLRTGPFVVHLTSKVAQLGREFTRLYGEYPTAPADCFVDYHVTVDAPNRARRWVRRNIVFAFDGVMPFMPSPVGQALPVFEWGLNWTLWNFAHHFLIIHAATIEKDGRVAILPAPPGSGKSTLCAALVHRGWRLLSDELALISLDDLSITPLARPIGLKNDSIDIIRSYVENAVMSTPAHGTTKGTVALLKAPSESIARQDETARPAWIITPNYQPDADPVLEPVSKAETCIAFGTNAINYSMHGARGFATLADVIDLCDCYRFTYSRLDDAVACFAALTPPG